MNSFQEKREAKAERYRDLARKAQEQSNESYSAAQKIGNMIPFGQPILVGHHSEKRARADSNKIDCFMRKSIAANEKAEYYSQKAKAVENNTAIFSDDPEAITKLKRKLEGLEKDQVLMKKVNVAYRKFKKNPESLESSDLPEEYLKLIQEFEPSYSWDTAPIASYILKNNGANIRRCKERLKYLEKQSLQTTQVLFDRSGVKIIDNVEANRLQIVFPDKPSEETRTELKQHGFRWSKYHGVWQRHRSNHASYLAENIVKNCATTLKKVA